MRSSSRNSIANSSPKASISHYPNSTIPDRTRSHPTFPQSPDSILPSFFTNFIKSPKSFGLPKEPNPTEYFVNTSFEETHDPKSSPKAPYFLREGAVSNKPSLNNGQSHDLPSRPGTSCTLPSPPRSFAHFNRFKGTTTSPDIHHNNRDFFNMPIDTIDRKPPSVPRGKMAELSAERDIRDRSAGYDQSYQSVRPAGHSKAYADAMKALQDQVKELTEKTQVLETENELLKKFQKEHVEQIEQDYQERIGEYQCSSRYIQDGLTNLETQTIQLTQAKMELEEKVKAVSKENKKLKEDRSKLKKKIESLNGDNRFREQTFGGMGKMLDEAKEAIKQNAQDYKNKEEKLQSEISSLKKEKEELKSINKNLTDRASKLEKDLALNKKSYNQHIQQLSLASDALKLDNDKLKASYGDQLADFQEELEQIHASHMKRISKFEDTVAELSQENSKFKELIALKNKELESLKNRTAEEVHPLKEIKLMQSQVNNDYFLKDSIFERSKLSHSRHINTSIIEKPVVVNQNEYRSVARHSPIQMRQYARRLLTDGDASDMSSIKVSFNYTTCSPDRTVKEKSEEVLVQNGQEKSYSPKTRNNPIMNTSMSNRISTSESFCNNKRRTEGRNESPGKQNHISKEDELSLSSIFTENNSFTRKEPTKTGFIMENFKDKLQALSQNNKFGLSSEETLRGHINSKNSNLPSDSDRNNTSRDYIQTLKRFSKAAPSNFSFGEIPKSMSFRQCSVEESETKNTQRSSYISPRGV